MSAAAAFGALRHAHRDERIIAWATTPAGRIVITLVGGGLLLAGGSSLGQLAAAAFFLVQVAPELRRQTLSLAGVGVIYTLLRQGWDWQANVETLPSTPFALVLGMTAAVVAACYAVFLLSVHFKRLPRFVRIRPILLLHVALCAVVFVIPLFAPGGGDSFLQLYAGALLFLMWRLSYLLQSGRRGRVTTKDFPAHFFALLPVFGGTNVPYGKGYDHLARHEAHDPLAFSASQLAGLKLLVLSWLWLLARDGMGWFVHGEADTPLRLWFGFEGPVAGHLGVPQLAELVAGEAAALPMRWTSLFVELVTRTLEIAAEGHAFIGALRLYGFNVFRNTYKPLLAETLLDFWGRFHHYFKELLVDFFFLPTYVRWFRGQPRLRMFAAVFAAAFLGNLYFHVVTQATSFANHDAAEVVAAFTPRAFYSFLLASGIFASMLRQQRRRGGVGPGGGVLRLRRIAGVWLFFAVIHVFNLAPLGLTLDQRITFTLSLIGIG